MSLSENLIVTSSMTAFGAARHLGSTANYSCEMRCVNHRFLDVHMRLPEELRAYEADIKDKVSAHLQRGRVDISIKKEQNEAASTDFQINQSTVEALFLGATKISELNNSVAPLSMAEVLRWPGVIQPPEQDAKEIKRETLLVIEECLAMVLESRKLEGAKLHQLIENRITEMREIVAQVQSRMPELQEQYRQRLEEKLATVRETMDENRLEQEMVLFLNKTDVMEELDRLHVHFDEVMRTMEENKSKGRRLDFLMQELNREANTLGSKSQDALLTKQSVELKVLIEQMREQVQNIE